MEAAGGSVKAHTLQSPSPASDATGDHCHDSARLFHQLRDPDPKLPRSRPFFFLDQPMSTHVVGDGDHTRRPEPTIFSCTSSSALEYKPTTTARIRHRRPPTPEILKPCPTSGDHRRGDSRTTLPLLETREPLSLSHLVVTVM